MSAPPNDASSERRPPLNERTPSQSNTRGIRVVPYTPPRLDGDSRAPSQASSHSQYSQQSQLRTASGSSAVPAGGRDSAIGSLDGRNDGFGSLAPPSGRPGDPGRSRNPSSDENSQNNRRNTTSTTSTNSTNRTSSSSFSTKRTANVSLSDSDAHSATGGFPGYALSGSSASSLQLTGSGDGSVSGAKIIPERSSGSPASPASPTSPTFRWPPPRSSNLSGAGVHASSFERASRSPSQSRPTSSSSSASGATPRPRSRRRNFVAVHSDKTFSLVPLHSTPKPADYHGGPQSPQPSYTSTSRTSSHERLSSDFLSEDRPSSALESTVTLPDRSLSTPASSAGSFTVLLATDEPNTAASPWNYRLVGGLRKVPKTPDLKQKKTLYTAAASPSLAESPLAPLPEAPLAETPVPETPVPESPVPESAAPESPTPESPTPAPSEPEPPTRTLEPQPSFSSDESAQTASTTSETTNYKVYGHSSPVGGSSDSLVERPSSEHTNYQILGQSSPAAPLDSSPLGSPFSDENFVVHGEASPSSSLVTVSRKPRSAYSQESLVVPPLRPQKKSSYEKFGYYKSRSRESLRTRAGSFKSIKSIRSIQSFSSLLGNESAPALLVAPVLLNLQAASSAGSSGGRPQDSWAAPRQRTAATTPPAAPISAPISAPRVPMQAQPHQWSSQLSTVMSESEGGSSHALSRSVSPASVVSAASHNGARRSSTGWGGSMHSRQLQSISSSLAAQLEEGVASSNSLSHSHSDSLDRPPPPAVTRGGTPGLARLIRDQDEHGDGLADLHRIQHRPSMRGLAALFASGNSSERNLHSSGSSRANSFSSVSIPAWARIYYGSGERRFFGTLSDFAPSESGDSSRPSSAFRSNSGSPRADQFPQSIHNPRRRPQDARRSSHKKSRRQTRRHGSSADAGGGSMDISPLPPMEDFRVQRGLRRITSSIWSPHLRMDRRASRYSMWGPPSATWSAESGFWGRRNVQIVLFAVGFIFPFAWMFAAFLPLPPKPTLPMMERNHQDESQVGQTDHFGLLYTIDDSRYQSAKWWRTLNRLLSVLGLVVIGAIVALAVVGVRERWA